MDKNKEHGGIGSEDFRRYRNGGMTGEERNAFERELQKDPFSEGASEGFLLISANEAEEDLKKLRKKLGKRTGKRTVAVYYRIAAAVAILVTVTVIFFNRNRETEFMVSKSETVLTDTPVSIAASEPIKDLTEKAESKNEPAKRSQQISPLPPVSPSPRLAVTEQTELSAEDKADTKDLVKEEVLAVAGERDLAKADESAEAEKKMEMSRGAGVSAPMATKGRSASEHTEAMPIAGIDSFNLYIEKNIRIPDTTSKQEETVIISFIVKSDSTLSDFRIIESPGQSYSREAKRLLKDGPRWKPATENGIPVSEETRISIVFR